MNSTGKILIVDDEAAFIGVYRDLLAQQGYVVDSVSTADEARARVRSGDYSVILLDQKLQGSGGSDTGLDLLTDLLVIAPDAKIIIATAFASEEAIRRAFAAGAYEYLEKNPRTFATLLPIKVRNAAELRRERAFGRLARDASGSERRLAELWSQAQTEQDANRKGRLLEDLVGLLFRGVPGFEEQQSRVSNGVQEIDLTIVNQSNDPVWSREGSVILVECKNLREPVPERELLVFEGKMRRYRGRCRLGFLVAPSGFTGPLRVQQTATSTEPLLIVTIDRADLEALISAKDRNEALRRLFLRATAALGGGEK